MGEYCASNGKSVLWYPFGPERSKTEERRLTWKTLISMKQLLKLLENSSNKLNGINITGRALLIFLTYQECIIQAKHLLLLEKKLRVPNSIYIQHSLENTL